MVQTMRESYQQREIVSGRKLEIVNFIQISKMPTYYEVIINYTLLHLHNAGSKLGSRELIHMAHWTMGTWPTISVALEGDAEMVLLLSLRGNRELL